MITPVGPTEFIAFAAMFGTDAEMAARRTMAVSALTRGLVEWFYALQCIFGPTPSQWRGVNYYHWEHIKACHDNAVRYIDEAYEFWTERVQ